MKNLFLARFITYNRTIRTENDSASVVICCYVRYMVKKCLGSCKQHLRYLFFMIFQTKHYVIICLRQLLCICKIEKTRLNDWVVIGGGGYVLIELLQTNYKR